MLRGRAPHARSRRRSEDGIGLIEIIVVVIIILLLGSIAMLTTRSTKAAARMKAATAAATSYGEAIESYMADNGQTPPALGTAAWPTATPTQRRAGPLDPLMAPPKPYISHAPEAVSDGIVDIGANRSIADPNTRIFITYTTTATGYRLQVDQIGPDADPKASCVVTNITPLPSGQRACS